MGPRPIGRGNPGPLARGGAGHSASMGPRPIGRGNLNSRRAPTSKQSGLQWGRDRSVAEIWVGGCNESTRENTASMGPRPIGRGNEFAEDGDAGVGALQWGRDRSVAEIQNLEHGARAGPAGFNGAATDRSRKFVRAAWRRQAESRASMGPRPIGRGNPNGLGREGWPWLELQWGRDRSVAEIVIN